MIGLLVYYFVVSVAVDHSFGNLQNEITKQRTNRTIFLLEQYAKTQRESVRHAVTSPDAGHFFGEHPHTFLEKKIEQKMGVGSRDFILVFDQHKNLTAAVSLGPDQRVRRQPPDGLESEIFRHSKLLGREEIATVISPIGNALYMISSSPVEGPDGSGPSPGWVAFGRGIGIEDFEQIQATTAALLRPVEKTVEAPDKLDYRISRIIPTSDLGDCSIYERSANEGQGDLQDILVEIENSLTPAPVQLFVEIPPIIYSTAIDFRNHLFLITSACGLLLIIGILIATEILFVRRIARMDHSFMNLAESGEAGMNHFLTKPVRRNALYAALSIGPQSSLP